MTRQWFLRGHRIIWSRPVETWHAWRYWRRFARVTRRDLAAIRAHQQDQP